MGTWTNGYMDKWVHEQMGTWTNGYMDKWDTYTWDTSTCRRGPKVTPECQKSDFETGQFFQSTRKSEHTNKYIQPCGWR